MKPNLNSFNIIKINKKTLIIIGIAIFLLLWYATYKLMSTTTEGVMQYNASLSELKLPKSEILFARSNDTYGIDIYKINSDGSGLKYLYKTSGATWDTKSEKNTSLENMGVFIGSTKYKEKKVIVVTKTWLQQLVLIDKGKKTILKEARGLTSVMNILAFKWMPDGKHLLIEDYKGDIGIFDTKTRKYAYLTEGFMTVPQPISRRW